MKLQITARVIFFAGAVGVSWSMCIYKGRKELQRLSDGKIADDRELARLVLIWEQAGIDVVATKYLNGRWFGPKPIREFARFRRLL